MQLSREIENIIDLALQEDVRSGDITTNALLPANAQISAKLFLRQAGVVAGFDILKYLFNKIDNTLRVEFNVNDGVFCKAGTTIVTISGNARAILTGERAALNLLQHISGIATVTAAYVKEVAGFNCAIMDTRKTAPGLRELEKYAVRMGGGKNHRFGLDDRLVIKTNHLSFLAQPPSRAILEALDKIKREHPSLPVEIEIHDPKLLDITLNSYVEAIMLRNMSLKDITSCVGKIRKTNKKVYVGSASAITLDVVRAYAATGVDGIAIGSLTHPTTALDIGVRLA